jgi:predicted phosphoadenosine phosphosulfate sulfurtransferase
MKTQKVPSYKTIALAILKNDNTLQSLGFSVKDSEWYYKLKEIEFEKSNRQGKLF